MQEKPEGKEALETNGVFVFHEYYIEEVFGVFYFLNVPFGLSVLVQTLLFMFTIGVRVKVRRKRKKRKKFP